MCLGEWVGRGGGGVTTLRFFPHKIALSVALLSANQEGFLYVNYYTRLLLLTSNWKWWKIAMEIWQGVTQKSKRQFRTGQKEEFPPKQSIKATKRGSIKATAVIPVPFPLQ